MSARFARSAGKIMGIVAISFSHPAAGAEEALSLTDAVRETLAANLDLAAQQEQLDANREQIGVARAALLPQIGAGFQGQYLDDDRPDGVRGNVTQGSGTVSAGLSQVLYDDDTWAGYTIQKHVYDSQRSQFETFRLSTIADAAKTFLELERAEALLQIQKRNREVTRRNMETARARVATGYSGERDVLRWQSQLSANETDVVQAQVLALVNRFELNRVRDREREAAIEVVDAKLEEYGFVFARDSIASALGNEQASRSLRDVMVRFGLSRSPVLAALDASIEAEKRQVTAGYRSFWVPTLSFGAGVNYLAAKTDSKAGASTTNDAEWGVKAGLSIPLLEGGGRLASLRESQSTLSSLRTQRRSQGQTIEESIRRAFAQANGSYLSLGYAREQEAASKQNFDLVNQSYEAGVSSILDLLDAQTQLLDAQIGVANAHYGFLEDLMAAEQQIAFFSFLEPESDVSKLLDQLEAALRSRM